MTTAPPPDLTLGLGAFLMPSHPPAVLEGWDRAHGRGSEKS